MNSAKITLFAFVFATTNSIFILLSQILRGRGYNFKLKFEKAKFETINNSIPILFLVSLSLLISVFLYESFLGWWQQAPLGLMILGIFLASVLVVINILYQLKN